MSSDLPQTSELSGLVASSPYTLKADPVVTLLFHVTMHDHIAGTCPLEISKTVSIYYTLVVLDI